MNILKNILFLLFLTSFSFSLRLRNKSAELKYEEEAEKAINRIKNTISYLTDTSCKVAAKFILLSITNTRVFKALPEIHLTGTLEYDLKRMEEKLNLGYILQVEIKANHHFILFRKNKKDLYLLQAFQDRFTLKSWITNKEIMEPYLTIDEFFKKFHIMLNKDTPRKKAEQMLIELFLPKIFTNNQSLIDSTLEYFRGKPIELIKVNYVYFNFSLKERGIKFKNLFLDVANHNKIY